MPTRKPLPPKQKQAEKTRGEKKSGGLFRGPTPEKAIQTVSIGEGLGPYIETQAKKFPNRKYVAVDPAYKGVRTLHRDYAKRLEDLGAGVRAKEAVPAVEQLIREGYKVRHFNVDMPNMPLRGEERQYAIEKFGFDRFLRKAKKVLLPNGKVYFTSEVPEYLEAIAELAREAGYKTRALGRQQNLQKSSFIGRTIRNVRPVFRLECTFGLKEAGRLPRK